MPSNITLEITPGSTIDSASADACRVAALLGIGVEFQFNGVTCLARPLRPSAEALALNQQDEQARALISPLDRRFVSTGEWWPRT